ncbi:MAG: hypothetical protein VYE22_30385 [Myxococcota bacterium]|nr:hypothetical protein [Myxococcota bacterium]
MRSILRTTGWALPCLWLALPARAQEPPEPPPQLEVEVEVEAEASVEAAAPAEGEAPVEAELEAPVAPELEAPVDELDGDAPPPAANDDGFESAFDDEFAELDGYLGVQRGVWVLDDGGGDAPWQDYDPPHSYQGRSLVRFGAQLRVAALPGGKPPVPEGPLGELGFVLDARYSAFSAWHFRAVLAVSAQTVGRAYMGGGEVAISSPFAMRLRLMPIAFDIGQYVALRTGPEIGMQWAENAGAGGTFEVLLGHIGEIVVRLLDERLEVGVHFGVQLTALGRVTRTNFGRELVPQGVVGGSVAWLFD